MTAFALWALAALVVIVVLGTWLLEIALRLLMVAVWVAAGLIALVVLAGKAVAETARRQALSRR